MLTIIALKRKREAHRSWHGDLDGTYVSKVRVRVGAEGQEDVEIEMRMGER